MKSLAFLYCIIALALVFIALVLYLPEDEKPTLATYKTPFTNHHYVPRAS
ncbi:MAG: hypothetical protein QG604_990 [Candidatus Dependentiae bacterium]|nr:hypothetical protein [Candidatus Dependentiae bacterium]